MANLEVTFGRATDNPPIMIGRNCRSESITIGATSDQGDLICDAGSYHGENVADLYAGGNCWVQIGSNPSAEPPGTDPYSESFFMATGERMQKSIAKGDRVAVIQA